MTPQQFIRADYDAGWYLFGLLWWVPFVIMIIGGIVAYVYQTYYDN